MKEFQPFTYRRALDRKTRSRTRRTINAPIISRCGKKSYNPTCVYKNTIDHSKFKKFAPTPPAYWPPHLSWPEDILKAVYYDPRQPAPKSKGQTKARSKAKRRSSSKVKTPTKSLLVPNISNCSGIDCPKPYYQPHDPAKLCTCTSAPWDTRNNAKWSAAHIEIKHKSDELGCCIVSRSDFAKDTVLGEYVGEIIPPVESHWSPYLMNLDTQLRGKYDNHNENLGYVDSLRMGNWTRFMNHSCSPNVNYVTKRVGAEARLACVAVKNIKKGDELTADYGEQWWSVMKDRGGKCGCGEKDCEYSDGSQTDDSQKK